MSSRSLYVSRSGRFWRRLDRDRLDLHVVGRVPPPERRSVGLVALPAQRCLRLWEFPCLSRLRLSRYLAWCCHTLIAALLSGGALSLVARGNRSEIRLDAVHVGSVRKL